MPYLDRTLSKCPLYVEQAFWTEYQLAQNQATSMFQLGVLASAHIGNKSIQSARTLLEHFVFTGIFHQEALRTL